MQIDGVHAEVLMKYTTFSWKFHGGVAAVSQDLGKTTPLDSRVAGTVLTFQNHLTALDSPRIALSHVSLEFLSTKLLQVQRPTEIGFLILRGWSLTAHN